MFVYRLRPLEFAFCCTVSISTKYGRTSNASRHSGKRSFNASAAFNNIEWGVARGIICKGELKFLKKKLNLKTAI